MVCCDACNAHVLQMRHSTRQGARGHCINQQGMSAQRITCVAAILIPADVLLLFKVDA